MEKNEYNLVPILEPKTNTFQIERFDTVKAACERFIEDTLAEVDFDSLDFDNYALVKTNRTAIRKQQDAVKDVRITCNLMAMGRFNEQARCLENMLKEADEKLRKYVKDYELKVKNKTPAPQKITLTVKGYDIKTIEKVRDFALKQKLEVSIA